ncbi:MAG: GNAT family N-acetyltransferase [Xanthobacteraceae bacterium]
MDQIIIELLPTKSIQGAVDLLAVAFKDDPIFCFHFPDPSLRRKVFELFFGDVVRAHIQFGHVYGAFDGKRLIGAAVWRPPNAVVAGMGAQLRTLITRYRVLALSPRLGKMLLKGFAGLEQTHPRHPHWYLFFIGVDSSLRGRNIGAQLMAPVHEAAEAAELPCYLETPFRQTLPFYRRLRYEVTSEPRPFEGAPQLWAMTRKPRPQK